MKTYTGGCHCSKVRYEVTADLDKVISCNCSHCSQKGLLLAFVPAENFKLTSGGDDLTDYQFNKKIIHHLFCSTCGVQSFSRGVGKESKEVIGINVRCLDAVDINALVLTPFDGKSW